MSFHGNLGYNSSCSFGYEEVVLQPYAEGKKVQDCCPLVKNCEILSINHYLIITSRKGVFPPNIANCHLCSRHKVEEEQKKQ